MSDASTSASAQEGAATAAMLDIGTNATRMLIGAMENGVFVQHFFVRVPVQLGRASYGNECIIAPPSLECLVSALQGLKKIAAALNVHQLSAIATAAVRDCRNRDEVLQAVRERAGIDIIVLTGNEEASLAGAFVSQQFPGTAVLNIDSGGGSTDCAVVKDEVITQRATFQVGTARDNNGAQEEQNRMHQWLADNCPPDAVLVASGGGARKLHDICGGINIAGMEEFVRRVEPMTITQRVAELELTPDRALNIIPAAKINIGILRACGADDMRITKGGLGQAALAQLLAGRFPAAQQGESAV